MGSRAPSRFTFDDLLALPEDNVRREVIDGELLVSRAPSLRHQRVVLRLGVELYRWAQQHGGEAFANPVDNYFAHDNVVEPDVLLVRREHLDRLEDRIIRGGPDLAVEVSSPSTRRLDLLRKRELYERFGVAEYWFVDLDTDEVLVHRLAAEGYGQPQVLRGEDVLTSPDLPGFALPLRELFAAPPR